MQLTFEQLPKAVSQINEKLENIERLLAEKIESPKIEQEQLLTIQETAQLINLTVPTIYGLVSRSSIPCMKKGKRLYFSKNELFEWIKSGRKKTFQEIESKANHILTHQKKKRK